MASKVSVKGSARAPLYAYLSTAASAPGWNFTKYLTGKDGKVIGKFEPSTKPESEELKSAIERALR
jgi:glutathione peroxidase